MKTLSTLFVAVLVALVCCCSSSPSRFSVASAGSTVVGPGKTTWYSDWARGACEIKHKEQYTAALPTAVFKKQKHRCGQWMKVSYGGKSVKVRFLDECDIRDNCHSQLDLSIPAFKKLAPPVKGEIKAVYEWIE